MLDSRPKTKEMRETVFVTIGKTKHFQDGHYEDYSDPVVTINGNIYEYRDIVSIQFNQLKGKLFNLIEASVVDTKQREAMKGLVKDFCNHQYKNVVIDLESWVKRLGFDIEESMTINQWNPLEPQGDQSA